MKTRKSSTKQERYEVVKRFLNSGQTKFTWCKENDITSATLCRWIKEYHSLQDEVTFVPLQPGPGKKSVSKPQSKSEPSNHSNEILIELGACKIHVPEHMGLSVIMKMMKEVEGLDV